MTIKLIKLSRESNRQLSMGDSRSHSVVVIGHSEYVVNVL